MSTRQTSTTPVLSHIEPCFTVAEHVQLGSGAQGTVYLAHNTLTDDLMAVKVEAFGSQPVLQIESEANMYIHFQTSGQCPPESDLQGRVPVMRCAEPQDSGALIVLSYGPTTVGALAEYAGCLSVGLLLEFFKQLIQLVAALQRMSVLHCDIKPDNLLLDKHGNLQLMDFGFAELFSGDEGVTPRGGTPCFTSPRVFDSSLVFGLDEFWSAGMTAVDMFLTRGHNYPESMWSEAIHALYYGTGACRLLDMMRTNKCSKDCSHDFEASLLVEAIEQFFALWRRASTCEDEFPHQEMIGYIANLQQMLGDNGELAKATLVKDFLDKQMQAHRAVFAGVDTSDLPHFRISADERCVVEDEQRSEQQTAEAEFDVEDMMMQDAIAGIAAITAAALDPFTDTSSRSTWAENIGHNHSYTAYAALPSTSNSDTAINDSSNHCSESSLHSSLACGSALLLGDLGSDIGCTTEPTLTAGVLPITGKRKRVCTAESDALYVKCARVEVQDITVVRVEPTTPSDIHPIAERETTACCPPMPFSFCRLRSALATVFHSRKVASKTELRAGKLSTYSSPTSSTLHTGRVAPLKSTVASPDAEKPSLPRSIAHRIRAALSPARKPAAVESKGNERPALLTPPSTLAQRLRATLGKANKKVPKSHAPTVLSPALALKSVAMAQA
ncbi:Serine/threonine-protein kinase 32B [Sorochytrium milnesiophthora]